MKAVRRGKPGGASRTVREKVYLTYPPKLLKEPVIYQLGQKFDVVTNLRGANISTEVGLVALEIDRQDNDDTPNPHRITLEYRTVELHAIALVAINAAAAVFGARELDLDHGIGEIGIAHPAAYWATTASGEASRLKAAANRARV